MSRMVYHLWVWDLWSLVGCWPGTGSSTHCTVGLGQDSICRCCSMFPASSCVAKVFTETTSALQYRHWLVYLTSMTWCDEDLMARTGTLKIVQQISVQLLSRASEVGKIMILKKKSKKIRFFWFKSDFFLNRISWFFNFFFGIFHFILCCNCAHLLLFTLYCLLYLCCCVLLLH